MSPGKLRGINAFHESRYFSSIDRSIDRSAQQKASSPPFPVYRGGVRGTRELGDVSNNWTRFNRGYLLYVLRVTNFLIMVTVI